jgi:hypothetical protein
MLSCAILCLAQKDPGVRGGPAGAGGSISGLKPNEQALFTEGRARTTQLESICDTCNDFTLGSDTGEDPNLAFDNQSQDPAAELQKLGARR